MEEPKDDDAAAHLMAVMEMVPVLAKALHRAHPQLLADHIAHLRDLQNALGRDSRHLVPVEEQLGWLEQL